MNIILGAAPQRGGAQPMRGGAQPPRGAVQQGPARGAAQVLFNGMQ